MWEWTLPSEKSPRKCRVVFRSFTLEINARHVSEANILPDSMDWLTSLAPCAKT